MAKGMAERKIRHAKEIMNRCAAWRESAVGASPRSSVSTLRSAGTKSGTEFLLPGPEQ